MASRNLPDWNQKEGFAGAPGLPSGVRPENLSLDTPCRLL